MSWLAGAPTPCMDPPLVIICLTTYLDSAGQRGEGLTQRLYGAAFWARGSPCQKGGLGAPSTRQGHDSFTVASEHPRPSVCRGGGAYGRSVLRHSSRLRPGGLEADGAQPLVHTRTWRPESLHPAQPGPQPTPSQPQPPAPTPGPLVPARCAPPLTGKPAGRFRKSFLPREDGPGRSSRSPPGGPPSARSGG